MEAIAFPNPISVRVKFAYVSRLHYNGFAARHQERGAISEVNNSCKGVENKTPNFSSRLRREAK